MCAGADRRPDAAGAERRKARGQRRLVGVRVGEARGGGSFVARMGASFMSGAGLGDWVATDEEDFVARARSLAADRAAQAAVR